ncbi:MAG: DsbA family protein [Candidatus Aenigmarchaeota archaeon]|nr:DsbA family protein [Candidatus Aenigmarchaeota archaeon]
MSKDNEKGLTIKIKNPWKVLFFVIIALLIGYFVYNNYSKAPETPRTQVSADDDPFKGGADAKVTIVEFSDYQCPYCARAESVVEQIMETYGNKVKFVYRDFPLPGHQFAQKAAEASECADDQGKFWEYHDLLFENQQSLSVGSLKNFAKALKLDSNKFDSCLDDGKYTQEVKKDLKDGAGYGVEGTPTFFINGIKLSGAVPFEQFRGIIDNELKKQ